MGEAGNSGKVKDSVERRLFTDKTNNPRSLIIEYEEDKKRRCMMDMNECERMFTLCRSPADPEVRKYNKKERRTRGQIDQNIE